MLRHLIRIIRSIVALACRGTTRALFVGILIQVFLDTAVTAIAHASGLPWSAAHLVGLAAVIVPAAVFGRLVRFPDSRASGARALGQILLALVAAFAVRGGILALLAGCWACPDLLIAFGGAICTAAVMFVFLSTELGLAYRRRRPHRLAMRSKVMLLVAAIVLLRLVYLATPELMPEEAYYWNYSQHPSPGYLDHPPMVAWLIGAGTALFGKTEFGVRFGTFCCWLVAAWFGMGLARELFGKQAAIGVLLLLASLPFFFGIGLIATPDAPLVACWAGTLFFLRRALLDMRRSAWYGVGLCLGLGLLSKYSIALLVPSAVLFVLFDPKSRDWLKRPEPYVALGMAALLFSPVIYWNATHEWVSFAFQTSRRVSETDKFSLHLLIGGVLALLSPTGLVAVAGGLARPRVLSADAKCDGALKWMLFLTLVPLTVYALFSLNHEPKLNWTGPVWLALLPAFAAAMVAHRHPGEWNTLQRVGRAWLPTAVVLTALYGVGLQFLVFGFPGVPVTGGMIEVAGWRQLGAAVDEVRAKVKAESGEEPLVVGFDKYNISSEMAFYSDRNGAEHTAGQSLFGKTALSYRYWFHESDQYGKNIILVARTPSFLHEPPTVARFERVAEQQQVPITIRGVPIGEYAYRVGYRFGPDTTLHMEKRP